MSNGWAQIKGGATVKQFKIVTINTDTLSCNFYSNGVAGTEVFTIAKPTLLRRSLTSRNGITYVYSSNSARVASSGATTENQVIIPTYVVGDIIYAMQVRGGTGVDSSNAGWIDINVDARAWCKATS